ncbi:unnamed protein product [Alopecurus aequalis]
MGTSASRSSPSLPTSCSLVETDSTTQLFTLPDYSRWARMPIGSALNFDTFLLLGSSYHLKVYPAGLDTDSADFIAVFVIGSFDDNYSHIAAARVSIEILDASRKHTVFDDHTARSEQTLRDHKRSKGYVRFVNRREMEASCCVREDDDSLTIRCTLSVDREVTKPLIMAPLPPYKPVEATAMALGSLTVMVSEFSRLRAALRTGECAHTPHFDLGGSSWYFKVYPNGHSDASKNCVAIFLGRGKSDRPATTAKFRFELDNDDLVEEETQKKMVFMEHTFDRDSPVHVVPCLVTSSDLAYSDDCLVVRCHLRVTKVMPGLKLHAAAAPSLAVPVCEDSDGKSPTGLGVVGEREDGHISEWDLTPLLADMHQR